MASMYLTFNYLIKVLEKTTDLSQVTDKTLSHTTQQCPNVRELYMQVQI
jgi:hypothetical protein